MNLDLKGRVAIVTGASAGIGRRIALQLALEGARVVAVARRDPLLLALADEVEQRGAIWPLVLVSDLYDRNAPQRISRDVADALGPADMLVNNAGGSSQTAINAADDEWDEAFALNFTAVRKLAQAVLPAMIDRGWGRIVNITGSTEPTGLNSANPAKSAVHAWAKGLSRMVAANAVTVNCITPGRIHSEQIDQKLYPTVEARDAFIREFIPMGYFGEAEDLANLAVFLCSERARYITGQRINVDGGLQKAIG